jgi:hypothetical protein
MLQGNLRIYKYDPAPTRVWEFGIEKAVFGISLTLQSNDMSALSCRCKLKGSSCKYTRMERITLDESVVLQLKLPLRIVKQSLFKKVAQSMKRLANCKPKHSCAQQRKVRIQCCMQPCQCTMIRGVFVKPLQIACKYAVDEDGERIDKGESGLQQQSTTFKT